MDKFVRIRIFINSGDDLFIYAKKISPSEAGCKFKCSLCEAGLLPIRMLFQQKKRTGKILKPSVSCLHVRKNQIEYVNEAEITAIEILST